MLMQVGLTVQLQLLEASAYNRKTSLPSLDQPPEQQTWDIALAPEGDVLNFPVYIPYHFYALDGYNDWVMEEPELRRLYEQALGTVDREQQEGLIRQMERHTRDRAYFLFLYNPIQLYAVNKAVEFVPYMNTRLLLDETSVTDQHWSVRQAGMKE
jgi:ABC-type transport system substrate-binding protein